MLSIQQGRRGRQTHTVFNTSKPAALTKRFAMAERLQTNRIGIIGSAEEEKFGLKAAVRAVDRGYI